VEVADLDAVAEAEWKPVADAEAMLPLGNAVALATVPVEEAKTCLNEAAAEGLINVLKYIRIAWLFTIYH
jgi:malic enzyme